jgi:hypothetical protein
MNATTLARATPIALETGIAVLSAALVLFLAGGNTAHARTAETPSMSKVVALHEAMDKLWTDHVTYTRLVILDFADSAPELKPHLTRLLRNQVDIGNAIKPYYGAAAGNKLTALLQTHIKQAVPVLQAAKTGDKPGLKKALAEWYANAHQIAAFLTKANPDNWPLSATTTMMNTHLKLTTTEAAAHLKRQWKTDIATYDKVRAEILMMAHTLADGIVKQHPDRFA